MFVLEIALLGLVFYSVFLLGSRKKGDYAVHEVPVTGVRLSQKLHQYRTMGVDRSQFEDVIGELTRRGVQGIPFFDGSRPDQEVASELDMLLEQAPYVPRELNEPGEDRLISKSTFSMWLRPKEEDDG